MNIYAIYPKDLAIIAREIRSSVTGLVALSNAGYPIDDDKFIVDWLYATDAKVFGEVVDELIVSGVLAPNAIPA